MASRRQFLRRTGMIVAGGALLAAPAARAQGEMIEYWIDESRSSANQDSRIRTLVFHYTAEDFATSLKLLTEPQYRTSAHYLVPDAATLSRRPAILRLVEEERRAWHAGDSYWRGQRYLNGASIGVEIVNRGYPSPLQDDWPPMRRDWQAFDDAQIAQVGKLAAGIVARHRIQPCDVVGHADIAPGRKMDPGPKFPWERLHREFGVGAWPDPDDVRRFLALQPGTPDAASWQRRLAAYGYDAPRSGEWDEKTRHAIQAFQMHFRPARYDGVPDAESSAILDALLDKYLGPVPGGEEGEHP
ncbi:N-acetylmuramoyl-L-alanine amidase [Chromobacterium violaceum]|uniref:N-acetylmuramoyl-L-alanine amidase n=1 Tax=Chromobacterium violaceum (strain ATCC 12472 / DSM 30191 / JCM 1249 / CCUG 213 / NBRC 12614 / NCIMB 9131 / NCTC 9757 / MK) TaxID=243365 RepID=Q7NYG5_CHRVO|nr:N-acetylmuramoyl-L-alanine amidase [Chromobacterium violaceum]AAQ58984.1 probable N-acetylmuramoyl-L-alanine amidase [Chromobacterium violaceum ATCC 12472]